MEYPTSQPLIAQGLVCAQCGYRLEGLPDAGETVRCPECGSIGHPIRPKQIRELVVRAVLSGMTIVASVLIVLGAAVWIWLAFQADWSLREARAASVEFALIGAGAFVTGCVAALARKDSAHRWRLAGVLVQLGFIVFALYRWRESFQMFTRLAPPIETLIFLMYATLAIATLAWPSDLKRWRSLISRPRVRRPAAIIAGVVVAAILIFGSVYMIRAGPQLPAARVLESRGARVSWSGPRVVAVFARALPLTDRDLALLSSLPHVESLELSDTRITDQGMVYVANLVHLKYLNVDSAAVTDSGIELLRGHDSLQALYASNTRITDAAMPAIATLKGLKELYIGGTSVSNDGLTLLRGLPDLKYVNVPGTRVTPRGGEELERQIDGLDVWAGTP